MINVSAIVSLRGLPAESTYGLSSAFYYIFAAVFFLIPVSLVAAELTTGWPQKGGVFRWVGEAFGTRLGFLAIWLQWIQTTIWFPTVLTFAAVSLAYMGPDQSWDQALALCLAFGVLAQVVAWVGGPSKGLLQVGCAGYLPRFMQRTNGAGVQVGISHCAGLHCDTSFGAFRGAVQCADGVPDYFPAHDSALPHHVSYKGQLF